MSWIVKEIGYCDNKIEFLGSKFSIGNGYMGYRGTLEEYSKRELTACTIAGLFDDNGSGWREPVNAPNPFFIKIFCDGEPINVFSSIVFSHEQLLNISCGHHIRKSEFITNQGKRIIVTSERFCSINNLHLMAMRYSFKTNQEADIIIETGIDGDIWDLNGPHLETPVFGSDGEIISFNASTHELKCNISMAEIIEFSNKEQKIVVSEKSVMRNLFVHTKANYEYTLDKYISTYNGNDEVEDTLYSATEDCKKSFARGYSSLLDENIELWKRRWEMSDVIIKGDEEAQLAIRYSMYLLLISSPFHTDKVAIPARGLSGQVYKGAMFWDTEIYMLQYFTYTFPEVAKNLVRYRVNTLGGARKKALEYGYKGAFYPWESQETGEDGCTHYNLNDIFTGRPIRTYFRDKQIHISADVVYGIWTYYKHTGDENILLEGGAEVILECVRFLFSYSYFKKEKNRYELLDVTGADEYHERVNNDAYTNSIVKFSLECALDTLKLLKTKYPQNYIDLIDKIDFKDDIMNIEEMNELLYVPKQDRETNLVEQFDGYFKLEDLSVEELKKRIILPNEYLGSPTGLAVDTQILKQADVVLQMNLFRERYTYEVKKANWFYYEPRTEHGSSLSTCVYALLAAEIGESEWAYKYFMKSASIDLLGDYKLYLGDLYIGGTHPAANGGSWMVAVLGFGGLNAKEDCVDINPKLPEKWDMLKYSFCWKKQKFHVSIRRHELDVTAAATNDVECIFNIQEKRIVCKAGERKTVIY